MITVLNKLKQPLSLNLDGGRGIIVLARAKASMTPDEFKSLEVQNGIESGSLLVVSMDTDAKPQDSAPAQATV